MAPTKNRNLPPASSTIAIAIAIDVQGKVGLYSGRETTDRAAESNAANASRLLIGNHLAPVIYDSRQAIRAGFKSPGHIHFHARSHHHDR